MDAQSYSTILTALSVAAGLALGVERIIEFLKHVMEMDKRSLRDHDKLQLVKRAKDLYDQVKTLSSDIKTGAIVEVDPARYCTFNNIDDIIKPGANKTSTEGNFADSEADEKYPAPSIAVVKYRPAPPVEAGRLVFFQLAAAGLGIFFASIFDLHLMQYFLGVGLSGEQIKVPGLLDLILTGLVIGGGSQPIHVLIRFITKRKLTAEDIEKDQGQNKPKVPAAIASTGKTTIEKLAEEKINEPLWLPIDYNGGINRDVLQTRHVRTHNPNLIVYHHTAMSDRKTFQDIVDEFLKSKGWLTGYHCVIMPDGAIKPFCRWDRYGNHAKGNNMHSLGIAFHGNFEIDGGDKFSNADGRYGIKRPTDAQLRAGARVVALWAHIYEDIEMNTDCIKPHKAVMKEGYTVCPGSNFPHDEFMKLAKYYYDGWQESDDIMFKISMFAKKQYLKV